MTKQEWDMAIKAAWCRLFHKWFGKETQVFQNYLAKHNMTPLVYSFEFYCPKCNKVYWRKTG